MKYLHKVFLEKTSGELDKVYNNRISFESAKRLNLSIKPIDQSNVFDLYYVPTTKIIELSNSIHKLAGHLKYIFEQLPPVAKEQFIRECVVEELYSTNELEGVRSTKTEIANSVRNVESNNKKKIRFNSMVHSYLSLLRDETEPPLYPKDIRSIYNNITEEEIDQNELPDGELFRKEINYVLSRTGNQEVIHRGIIPEEKIINEIDKLLDFMNNDHNTPPLIRSAIGHYYFGYIHPFYDGNGRTSRFISSIYLAETIGKVAALSLSRGCNKYKSRYLKAFEVANSIQSRGEMNYFIDEYLTIIFSALKDMVSELKEKIELMETAIEKLKTDKKLLNKSESYSHFMFVLVQNHYFHYSDGVTVRELARVMEVSSATVRKIARYLIEESVIEQNGTRPAYYMITHDYLENE